MTRRACGDKPLLVGGGAGVPPLYGLCKRLIQAGKSPRVVMGFNTAAEVSLREDFEALGVPVYVTTADGSQGMRGFVTAALTETDYDFTYACGPEPMLKALYQATDKPGQYSFEARMACAASGPAWAAAARPSTAPSASARMAPC